MTYVPQNEHVEKAEEIAINIPGNQNSADAQGLPKPLAQWILKILPRIQNDMLSSNNKSSSDLFSGN